MIDFEKEEFLQRLDIRLGAISAMLAYHEKFIANTHLKADEYREVEKYINKAQTDVERTSLQDACPKCGSHLELEETTWDSMSGSLVSVMCCKCKVRGENSNNVVKRKIVKPYKKEQSFNLCVYECRVCGVTLKYGNTNEKNPSYPNFCWCCGTQLKEVDTKLFELWGIEP